MQDIFVLDNKNSNKLSLFQWDLNQRFIVTNSNIKQAHYYISAKEEPLSCEVYEESGIFFVNIPNILLQKAGKYRVYAYGEDATISYEQFEVVARPKPSDYIYTETDLIELEAVVKELLEQALESENFLEALPRPVDDKGQPIDGHYFYGLPSSDSDNFDGDLNKLMLIRGASGRGGDTVVMRDKHNRFMVQDPEFDFAGEDAGYRVLGDKIRYYAANRGFVLDNIDRAKKSCLPVLLTADMDNEQILIQKKTGLDEYGNAIWSYKLGKISDTKTEAGFIVQRNKDGQVVLPNQFMGIPNTASDETTNYAVPYFYLDETLQALCNDMDKKYIPNLEHTNADFNQIVVQKPDGSFELLTITEGSSAYFVVQRDSSGHIRLPRKIKGKSDKVYETESADYGGRQSAPRYYVDQKVEEELTTGRADIIKYDLGEPDYSVIEAINRNLIDIDSLGSVLAQIQDQINGVEEELKMLNEGGIQ